MNSLHSLSYKYEVYLKISSIDLTVRSLSLRCLATFDLSGFGFLILPCRFHVFFSNKGKITVNIELLNITIKYAVVVFRVISSLTPCNNFLFKEYFS